MTGVLSHADQDRGVGLDPAQEGVAGWAQQPAHLAGAVVVVDEQIALNAADQAPAVLSDAHGRDVLGGESVLAHQACPQILGAGGLRVVRPPLSEPLVAPGLVVSPVPPTAFVGAWFAVGAHVLARLAERREGQVLLAVDAPLGLSHDSSFAYQRGNVSDLDQPCHADVLLEIANRNEEDR